MKTFQNPRNARNCLEHLRKFHHSKNRNVIFRTPEEKQVKRDTGSAFSAMKPASILGSGTFSVRGRKPSARRSSGKRIHSGWQPWKREGSSWRPPWPLSKVAFTRRATVCQTSMFGPAIQRNREWIMKMNVSVCGKFWNFGIDNFG